jgi:hypothetical protein
MKVNKLLRLSAVYRQNTVGLNPIFRLDEHAAVGWAALE